MSTAIDDMFGSSDDEFDSGLAAAAAASAANRQDDGNDNDADLGLDDSDSDNAAPATAGGTSAASGGDDDPLADSDDGGGDGGAVGGLSGTGLSDSEDDGDGEGGGGGAPSSRQASGVVDDDLFGSDSDDSAKGTGGKAGGVDDDDDDPFADSDDGDAGGKTLNRLSKGKGKAKANSPGGGGSEKKKKKKGSKGGKSAEDGTKKKKKKKRKRGDGEAGADVGGGSGGGSATKKVKKNKGKKKKADKHGDSDGAGSDADSLGLGSDSESEADLDDVGKEERDDLLEGAGDEKPNPNVRTQDDDDFIDDGDDDQALLSEYRQDVPPPGSDSEAEEDNSHHFEERVTEESPMVAVMASMRRRKAQDLSTAEREQIAQEFLFKINKAADDDEEAVQNGKPALNKLKLLKLVKATLAKKELQETFLEFDLLGVVKRWLQPYSNGQLPNLTIRSEMLTLVLGLPVQVDHLKRSGIGVIVMGLLKSQQETTENKRVLRQLMQRWNRPIYEKETNYRALRAVHDEPEAMEVPTSGSRARAGGGARRSMSGGMMQRDGPGRNETVGNILNATKRGVDPTKSRVPFSNGYAFAKAPRSRLEGSSRASAQQADTTARTKLLKRMAALSRPVSKG